MTCGTKPSFFLRDDDGVQVFEVIVGNGGTGGGGGGSGGTSCTLSYSESVTGFSATTYAPAGDTTLTRFIAP